MDEQENMEVTQTGTTEETTNSGGGGELTFSQWLESNPGFCRGPLFVSK